MNLVKCNGNNLDPLASNCAAGHGRLSLWHPGEEAAVRYRCALSQDQQSAVYEAVPLSAVGLPVHRVPVRGRAQLYRLESAQLVGLFPSMKIRFGENSLLVSVVSFGKTVGIE